MSINLLHLQDALIKGIEDLQPSFFPTLAFNRSVTWPAAERTLVEWGKRIERHAHGKYWAKQTNRERLRFYGFFEHMTSGPHAHVAGRGSDAICETIAEHGEAIWRKLTVTGSYQVEQIRSVRAVSRYITKSVKGRDAYEHFVVYAPSTIL